MQRVTIVGGAGDMARVVVRDLVARRRAIEVVLADRDVAKAERVAAALGVRGLRVLAADVFDPARVREVIRGSALVVNATGPYFRTGPPVLEACLDERTAYLDLGDDFEAADVLLAFDRAACAAGVTALVCAGLTPGLWNVVVRSLVDRFDDVERIALAWVTGSTPKRPGVERGGRAVLEHMLHEASGMTVTFQDGRRRPLPAFRRAATIRFPLSLGSMRVYDLGHAELATFPRSFPGVREVRTLGGLQPPVLNGVFQGIAAAVVSGRLEWDEAVDGLLALDDGDATLRSRATREALRGVAMQCLRREVSVREALALLRGGGDGLSAAPAGALFARVEGRCDGRRYALESIEVARGTDAAGAMDELTGGAAALFVEAFLDGDVRGPGVVAPEQAIAPEVFLPRIRTVFPELALSAHEVEPGSAWGSSSCQ